MMTPGDFASLQEGREGLSTEDYIAWKLPSVKIIFALRILLTMFHREEEEPDEFPYPLTLRTKKSTDRPPSPLDSIPVNGT
jgi:glycogen(starch) synthase